MNDEALNHHLDEELGGDILPDGGLEGIEKRRHQRVNREVELLMLCEGWRFPVMGTTVNISESGYMLVTRHAVRAGATLLLYEVPVGGFNIEPIREGGAFRRASIRWCNEVTSLKGYAWGLEHV